MATTKIGKSGGTFTGTAAGSEIYEFTAVPTAVSINGLTSTLNNSGSLAASGTSSTSVATGLTYATDRILTPAYRPGVVAATATGTDTNLTTGAAYNAKDVIRFSKSGDYTSLGGDFFTNIETLEFGSGVKVRLSAEIVENITNYADRGGVNTGITFEGLGSKTSQVTFDVEFEIEGLTTPAAGAAYVQAEVELDDYSFAKLTNDKVQLVFDARDPSDDDDDVANDDGLLQSSYGRYFKFDGSNDSELVYGSDGVDSATLRVGNDSMFGYQGNDRLVGHGGADSLDGGVGDDLFEITSFGSGNSGTAAKGDSGKPEWIISAADSAATGITNGLTNAADYGSKADLIVGGTGYDTLRVTSGVGATNAATGTIILSDANFQGMEKVEVGASLSRDGDESAFQQLRDGHLYFARSGTVSDTATSAGGAAGNSIDNVVINASRVTKNGLTFEGNANTQTFIGTTKADVFIGNGGLDTLTGGGGADKFVFQSIREYARDSGTANGVIAYTPTDFDTVTAGQQDRALTAVDADVINGFVTGEDKIVFRVEATTALEDTFDALVALTKGNLTATNVLIGNLSSGLDTAGTANQFIKVDTAAAGGAKVYYDADGSGVGAAVLVATLTNISTVGVSDFRVEAVQGF